MDFAMNKRLRNISYISSSLLLATMMAVAPLAQEKAQEPAGAPRERTPAPVEFEPAVERDASGRARVKFERGAKIVVGNKTTGRIVVTGWDRDYIEATATSQNGIEYVWVGAQREATGAEKILVKADYAKPEDMDARRLAALEQRRSEIEQRRAELEMRQHEIEAQQQQARRSASSNISTSSPRTGAASPASSPTPANAAPPLASTATVAPSSSPKTVAPARIQNLPGINVQITNPLNMNLQIAPPPGFERPFGDIDLEVKVPRAAEIDSIKVIRSEVEVSGVETALTIDGDRSTIKLSHVGTVEVRTRSGRVEVDNVRGLVDVITSSGQINVRQAGADVRALSISGEVAITCARGRVDVSNTDGAITLAGISGDVDATTTNSEVHFTGAIREDGRYHLKSMAGTVEMLIGEDAPGFTALLSSYRGSVKTDFQLQLKEPAGSETRNTNGSRLIGRYGNGQAQITLDSFDGSIRLGKLAPGEAKDCR